MASSGRFNIVALWCWYRGACFYGYQQQLDRRTVQREVLRAFSKAGLARNPVVAGRTDKYVSARMQVLSGRLEREVAPEALVSRLNAHLPEDLGIHLAREVKPGFHAAWSATSKEYRYHLGPEQAGDLALLQRAAALIPGTRDFKAFHFKTSEDKERTVTSVEIIPTGEGFTLRFVGAGFARHMVRMLVGGMTGVATGAIRMELFEEGLLRQRNFYCPTAPPEALTLWDVGYPAEVDPFSPGERASFDWPRSGLPAVSE